MTRPQESSPAEAVEAGSGLAPVKAPSRESTSRLIVKNLPKHMTVERFKDHFGAVGQVTDAKLIHTREGQFRRFGYIGFKTPGEARQAAKHFDTSFIDTSRIQVELAHPVGDSALPRPWSRHSEGSSAHLQKHQELKAKEQERLARDKDRQGRFLEQKIASGKGSKADLFQLFSDTAQGKVTPGNEKLQELLQAFQGRSKKQTWTNDASVRVDSMKPGQSLAEAAAKAEALDAKGQARAVQDIFLDELSENEDEYQELPSLGKPPSTTTPPAEPHDGSTEMEESEDSGNNVAPAPVSDLDWLKSKTVQGPSPELDAESSSQSEDDAVSSPESDKPAADSAPAAPAPNHGGMHPSRLAQAGLGPECSSVPASKPSSSSIQTHNQSQEPVTPADGSAQLDHCALPEETIADTGRLFVRNLPYSATTQDLQELFAPFGPVSEVHIPLYLSSKTPRGIAFVMYLLPEHAVAAYSELNGKAFQGRVLDILPGKEKPTPAEDPQTSAFAKKKLAKEKSRGEWSWNSLFMNSDTVAEAMAAKLGLKKSDLLDRDAPNMAVRMALAETQILQETKQYLEDAGVDLSAFERGGKKERSNTTLLVKNLPASTEEGHLSDLFGEIGPLGRLLLPPSKTIALVEFLEPNDAKSAFNRLSYTKFKHLPLYLEWAPVSTFTEATPPPARPRPASVAANAILSATPSSTPAPTATGRPAADALALIPADEEGEGSSISTLFIKNLSFASTDASLQDKFKGCPGLRSVRVAVKPDPKNRAAKLSMGFGFAEFDTKASAKKALPALQGTELDGHRLELKFSLAKQAGAGHEADRKGSSSTSKGGAKDGKGTKLLVKNIPFEANKKELRALFGEFGTVKSFRLPQKMDRTTRGFCFVDYATHQEARKAQEALYSTHFYGRPFVIEWAEEDDSIEGLRKRTTRAGVTGAPEKKARVVLDGTANGSDDDA